MRKCKVSGRKNPAGSPVEEGFDIEIKHGKVFPSLKELTFGDTSCSLLHCLNKGVGCLSGKYIVTVSQLTLHSYQHE